MGALIGPSRGSQGDGRNAAVGAHEPDRSDRGERGDGCPWEGTAGREEHGHRFLTQSDLRASRAQDMGNIA